MGSYYNIPKATFYLLKGDDKVYGEPSVAFWGLGLGFRRGLKFR